MGKKRGNRRKRAQATQFQQTDSTQQKKRAEETFTAVLTVLRQNNEVDISLLETALSANLDLQAALTVPGEENSRFVYVYQERELRINLAQQYYESASSQHGEARNKNMRLAFGHANKAIQILFSSHQHWDGNFSVNPSRLPPLFQVALETAQALNKKNSLMSWQANLSRLIQQIPEEGYTHYAMHAEPLCFFLYGMGNIFLEGKEKVRAKQCFSQVATLACVRIVEYSDKIYQVKALAQMRHFIICYDEFCFLVQYEVKVPGKKIMQWRSRLYDEALTVLAELVPIDIGYTPDSIDEILHQVLENFLADVATLKNGDNGLEEIRNTEAQLSHLEKIYAITEKLCRVYSKLANHLMDEWQVRLTKTQEECAELKREIAHLSKKVHRQHAAKTEQENRANAFFAEVMSEFDEKQAAAKRQWQQKQSCEIPFLRQLDTKSAVQTSLANVSPKVAVAPRRELKEEERLLLNARQYMKAAFSEAREQRIENLNQAKACFRATKNKAHPEKNTLIYVLALCGLVDCFSAFADENFIHKEFEVMLKNLEWAREHLDEAKGISSNVEERPHNEEEGQQGEFTIFEHERDSIQAAIEFSLAQIKDAVTKANFVLLKWISHLTAERDCAKQRWEQNGWSWKQNKPFATRSSKARELKNYTELARQLKEYTVSLEGMGENEESAKRWALSR